MTEVEAIVLESISSHLGLNVKDIVSICNNINHIDGYSYVELYIIIALALKSTLLNNRAISSGLFYILEKSMDESVVTEFEKWGVNPKLHGLRLLVDIFELLIITKEDKEINLNYKKLLAGEKYIGILDSLVKSCEDGRLQQILKCLKIKKRKS